MTITFTNAGNDEKRTLGPFPFIEALYEYVRVGPDYRIIAMYDDKRWLVMENELEVWTGFFIREGDPGE